MRITYKGTQIEILGTQPQVGDLAPEFVLKDLENKNHSLSEAKGQAVILSVIPNIDTRVCALQTKRFNQEASQLKEIYFATISNNSKEEQANWCGQEGVDMLMLHDTENEFGKKYGLFIPTTGHLARAIFVLDQNGVIVYEEIVAEMSHEPDYEKALDVAKSLS